MKFERSRRGFAVRSMPSMRVDDLAEDLLELHAREVRAEAVVLAVAERDVVVRACAGCRSAADSGNTSSSRFADGYQRISFAFSAISWPRISVGCVAVRRNECTAGREAQDLLDRAVEQRHVLLQRAQLIGVVEQADHAVAS